MKGLLKGLRYISQIFDGKEPEMKIGSPTDVKHVAHIGWDNVSSVTTPGWMQDFKAAPGPSKGGESEPSQAGGGGEAGECEPGEGGGAGGRAEQTERPRRTTKGKGLGASEAKRRDGAGEELRRDRRTLKAEAEGGEGHASAASKQRRKKPRASGGDTSSGGRSKSSSRGATASDSEAARSAAAPGAEDDRNGY